MYEFTGGSSVGCSIGTRMWKPRVDNDCVAANIGLKAIRASNLS